MRLRNGADTLLPQDSLGFARYVQGFTNWRAEMANFVLEGPKWGSTGLGTAGGFVTWAIDATIPASFLTAISSAFADWAHYANIQFQEVASTVSSQIDFSLGAIDGLNKLLGQTNYIYSGTQFTSASIEFDSGEGWHVAGSQIVSNGGVNLFEVALHEIGHAIGLGHYNAAPAVMNAYFDPAVTDLTQSDIDGAQAIYGHAPAVGSQLLVDDLFYYSHYPDVWNAHVDADQHYHQYGWHEGRDPNSFFSTSFYLSLNQDVKNAGVDPLVHFDQYGWHEGRQPSAAFDDAAYLAANPDVAAAHVDPLAHFLQYGESEGRQATALTSLIGPHGFDYVFYLQHNPDVQAAEVDPFQHYETFGWHEGRDPNALFDTNGYLAANPDVANAHINPLDHYDHMAGGKAAIPHLRSTRPSILAIIRMLRPPISIRCCTIFSTASMRDDKPLLTEFGDKAQVGNPGIGRHNRPRIFRT